jgi:hypothetical protein
MSSFTDSPAPAIPLPGTGVYFSHNTTLRRPAAPGEVCEACGRPAVWVYEDGWLGAWCGQVDSVTGTRSA